jgi:hypothetical protein
MDQDLRRSGSNEIDSDNDQDLDLSVAHWGDETMIRFSERLEADGKKHDNLPVKFMESL